MIEPEALEALELACAAILGGRPHVERTYTYRPGGALRGTLRVTAGGVTAYATRRRAAETTRTEAHVLQALSAAGAPVPRFLGFAHGWLLAADAGRPRLSEHIATAPPDLARALLARAITSLSAIQSLGHRAGLAARVTPFASGPEVADRLTRLPGEVGARLGVDPPARDPGASAELRRLLGAPGERFVKWDARPANATLDAAGTVVWFDFQHSNRRWPADDLVWLLCDESIPDGADAASLLARLADGHADDRTWSPGPARRYVATFGTAHVLVRLDHQLSGGGADWARCLAEDWNGSAEAARRLIVRGGAVSALDPLTAPLVPWFGRLQRAAEDRAAGDRPKERP